MRRVTEILFITLAAFFMSCGDETVVPALDEGWTAWENGLYATAHEKFTEAGGVEGLNGLGWTTLKMDSLPKSQIYFALAAVGGSDTLTDAAAGLAIVAWQQANHDTSLMAANYVLRKAPNYIFTHDVTITKNTMLLAKAYDEYHLLQYANCITSIQQIDNAFTANVNDPAIAQILINKLNLLSGTGS